MTTARLLIENHVSYSDFHDYQRDHIDYLIQQGVLQDEGQRIWFSSIDQFRVLRDLFDTEAASYYHYSANTRIAIVEMVARGWFACADTLLSQAEASYFNYCLNQVEFSNGPDLRNKYIHGSNVEASDEAEHFQTYITSLKLLIALVIKINDDFSLQAVELGEGQAL